MKTLIQFPVFCLFLSMMPESARAAEVNCDAIILIAQSRPLSDSERAQFEQCLQNWPDDTPVDPGVIARNPGAIDILRGNPLGGHNSIVREDVRRTLERTLNPFKW